MKKKVLILGILFLVSTVLCVVLKYVINTQMQMKAFLLPKA